MKEHWFSKILRDIKVSRSLTFLSLILASTYLKLDKIKLLRKPYFGWLSLVDKVFT